MNVLKIGKHKVMQFYANSLTATTPTKYVFYLKIKIFIGLYYYPALNGQRTSPRAAHNLHHTADSDNARYTLKPLPLQTAYRTDLKHNFKNIRV